MFKYPILTEKTKPDFTLNFLSMAYVTMVALSIVLFDQILGFELFNIKIQLAGAVVPYVFLYPISFIVLRVYGLRQLNSMMSAVILTSLLFVVMATVIANFSSNITGIHYILSNSIKMYIAGFIGMPAGIYTSFLILKWLSNINISFNTVSLTLATIAGEIVNTVIVFPIGFHGDYSLQQIFSNIIIDALAFKVIMGAILSFIAVRIISLLVDKKINQA